MNFELLPILTDYANLTNTILKGDHLRIISAKFGCDWLSSFRVEDFFNFVLFLSLVLFFLLFDLFLLFCWGFDVCINYKKILFIICKQLVLGS
jgi:hypothetical protein